MTTLGTAAFAPPTVAPINGAHPTPASPAPPGGLAGQPSAGQGLPPAVNPATPDRQTHPTKSKGAGGFYIVAVIATLISVDTSWRFFEHVLGITWFVERLLMFAVVEAALIACGWAMRANVRRVDDDGNPGTPGKARLVAWALCGASAYMAITLSGPLAGIARVVLGPILGIVALHLALGIEIRAHRKQSNGTWARVGRELRERFLSRIGLADDNRDAKARTRDRALERAARLATSGRAVRRQQRLAKAVRTSGAAADANRRAALVEQVATLRHLDDLCTGSWPSPWRAVTPEPLKMPAWDPAPTAADEAEVDAAIATARAPHSGGSRTRKQPSRTGRKSTGSRTRRTAEETRAEAAELLAEQPALRRAEVARLLGISERQLRNVLNSGSDRQEGAR